MNKMSNNYENIKVRENQDKQRMNNAKPGSLL